MDAIKLGGSVEVSLRGRALTVRDYDAGADREYVWEVDLDSVQTGQILGELYSAEQIITPDSIVGGWLQQAFNSGLGVGRAEAELGRGPGGFDWLGELAEGDLTDLGDAVVSQLESRNVTAKEFTS